MTFSLYKQADNIINSFRKPEQIMVYIMSVNYIPPDKPSCFQSKDAIMLSHC